MIIQLEMNNIYFCFLVSSWWDLDSMDYLVILSSNVWYSNYLSYVINKKIVDEEMMPICLLGTRNCSGASNGGVCYGSAVDTQLCDTNISCSS